MVLVEMLTAQESLGTVFIVGENAKAPPQGYVVDIGPALEADKWGIKVGDRVLLQGSYVPVPIPKANRSNRELGIVQAHDIKCVLQEECDD
jgi:co-chaperonin GroES (HSP10)